MPRTVSPFVAALVGVAATSAAFLLMGQGERAPRPPVVGVTSYDREGQHFAVAWEQQGRALVPAAWAVMDQDIPLKAGGISPQLAFAADRVFMQPERFSDDQPTQLHLSQLAQTLMAAPNEDTRRRAFTELWEAVKAASSAHAVCPTCTQERADCKSNPPECFERYVACVLYDCR